MFAEAPTVSICVVLLPTESLALQKKFPFYDPGNQQGNKTYRVPVQPVANLAANIV